MDDVKKITEILKAYTKKHNISASVVILEEYAEELVANGVIVPPCKVGDVVYTLCGERYFDDNGVEWERLTGKMHIEERQFSLGMMDKNYNLHSAYFLTKEEAEVELRKRSEDNAN